MDNAIKIVSQVLDTLQAPQPPDQVLDQAVALIEHLTHWPGVTLLAPCDEGNKLCVVAAAGPLAGTVGAKVPVDQSAAGKVWQLETTALSPQCFPDDRADDGALMFIPVRQGERVQMLLEIAGNAPEKLDAHARALAQALSQALALGLRSARHYEALQSELAERQQAETRFWATIHKTETLYRVSRTLNASYELTQILQNVVDLVASTLHAEQIILLALGVDDRQVLRFVVGGPSAESIAPMPYEALMDSPLKPVIVEGLPVRQSKSDMLRQTGKNNRLNYEGLVAGPLAAVPLFSRGRVFGALIALNREEQPDFTQQDVELMMAIAAQTAGAIHHAQLFEAVTIERGRLHALIQSSRDGVILLGLNMHILVINRPALWYLHLPGEPEAWVDQWFWDALSYLHKYASQAVDVMMAEIRRVQQGDASPNEGEMSIGPRRVHWLNLPVLSDEHPMGRLFVLRDVTEVHQLQQFREDLMHTMVHDLRNPLSGIYAALKLLRDDATRTLAPSQNRIVAAAQKSTQQMLKLVGEILDISRLESGKMPLNPVAFRIPQILRAVLAVEQPLAEQRDIRVHADMAAFPDVQVWADMDLVERVLQNLIGNALKFTPPGGSVAIKASIAEDIADKVQIAVCDTGTGIPPEIRERLFQKFVVGNQSGRGSGLGLTFCRMVLEAHGERIWIADTSERGTTVMFTLPMAGGEEVDL